MVVVVVAAALAAAAAVFSKEDRLCPLPRAKKVAGLLRWRWMLVARVQLLVVAGLVVVVEEVAAATALAVALRREERGRKPWTTKPPTSRKRLFRCRYSYSRVPVHPILSHPKLVFIFSRLHE